MLSLVHDTDAQADAAHDGRELACRPVWMSCVAMAYKLLDAAQARWRWISGHQLVALVRAGATFIDGRLQERTEAAEEPITEECGA